MSGDLSEWTLREKITAVGIRLLVGAICLLPRWLFEPIARGLGRVAPWLAKRDAGLVRLNADRVLGLAPGSRESRDLTRGVFTHLVVSGLETIRISRGPGIVELEGLCELRQITARADAAGRGHVMVTGHLGNWELLALAYSKAVRSTLYGLGKKSRNAAVTAFLEDLRARSGCPALWVGRKSLLRQMLEVLKQGDALGILMDQKPEGMRGPTVDFFGLPTEFVSGPGVLAARTSCAVIAVFCVRVGPFHYRLLVEEVVASGHGETDEQALTQKMASVVEKVVRDYPQQWSWNYRRWMFE